MMPFIRRNTVCDIDKATATHLLHSCSTQCACSCSSRSAPWTSHTSDTRHGASQPHASASCPGGGPPCQIHSPVTVHTRCTALLRGHPAHDVKALLPRHHIHSPGAPDVRSTPMWPLRQVHAACRGVAAQVRLLLRLLQAALEQGRKHLGCGVLGHGLQRSAFAALGGRRHVGRCCCCCCRCCYSRCRNTIPIGGWGDTPLLARHSRTARPWGSGPPSPILVPCILVPP
mmetsp:Transcript_27472/g.60093  ORF Transcript_27472/g.60093 Transcript_27472/m.60093 type:complete len:229 (-) Transcript_27472:1008-1694(-)